MQSVCPRCGAPMGEKQEATNVVMGMSVKGCSECGGFLIDYSEAEDVLGKATGKKDEAALTGEIVHPEAKKALTGSCPFCGGEFRPSPFRFDLTDKMVYLDQCAGCEGFWFDMGELGQILDFAYQEAVAAGHLSEDLETTFSTKSVTLACPRCTIETEFKTGEILGIAVSKCGKCSGIWLDHGEVESLIGEVTADSAEEKETVPEGTAAPGTCPRCRVALKRWGNRPEKLKDLYVDFCPSCMGLWFDKGEFTHLFRIFQESPFVSA